LELLLRTATNENDGSPTTNCEEYSELISALRKAFDGIARLAAPNSSHFAPEYQHAWVHARDAGLHAIHDRIFVADQIKQMKLLQKWTDAKKRLEEKLDFESYESKVEEMLEALKAEARKSMK
jgi:hypothetical protein